MISFDLRRVSLRSGEQLREDVELELEPLLLGGQTYVPAPDPTPARLAITKTSGGTLFELRFAVTLAGPCFRCLADAELGLSLDAREYHANDPGAGEDLRSDYVADDRLDLAAWARDTVVLELPDKILCRDDCAGLCPVCGKDLNVEPHVHEEHESDPRWEQLGKLRFPS
ncbi:MAG TPA: DUF177 domain-containing protein [Gaiellaceae bacterium]|nr:DUF177 domain-containing protein [Gaiellaceae bacterium]